MSLMRIIEGESKKSFRTRIIFEGDIVGSKIVHIPYTFSYSTEEENPRVTCHFTEYFPLFFESYVGLVNMQDVKPLSSGIHIGDGNYIRCLEQISFSLKESLLKNRDKEEIHKYEDLLKKVFEDNLPNLLNLKGLFEKIDYGSTVNKDKFNPIKPNNGLTEVKEKINPILKKIQDRIVEISDYNDLGDITFALEILREQFNDLLDFINNLDRKYFMEY